MSYNGEYSLKEQPDTIALFYRHSRNIGNLAGHAFLAYMTGGVSLLYSVPRFIAVTIRNKIAETDKKSTLSRETANIDTAGRYAEELSGAGSKAPFTTVDILKKGAIHGFSKGITSPVVNAGLLLTNAFDRVANNSIETFNHVKRSWHIAQGTPCDYYDGKVRSENAWLRLCDLFNLVDLSNKQLKDAQKKTNLTKATISPAPQQGQ